MKTMIVAALAALSLALIPATDAYAKKPKGKSSPGVSAVGTGGKSKSTSAAYGTGYSNAVAKTGPITVKGGDQYQSTTVLFFQH